MQHAVLLTHIKGIWLPPVQEIRPLYGSELALSNILTNGFILVRDGRIEAIGSMDDLTDDLSESVLENIPQYNCIGKYVLPAFADAHSHLVFAAWRENEMEMRLAGKSYLEIAAAGGGILNSALRLESTSEEQLFESAWLRLESLMKMGTGALEIKSGYGLSIESELKMLRVIRRIKEEAPIPIKATFLGAHAIPKKYSDRKDYIRLVVEEMIPAVAAQNLADYCDVFCDTGFFTPDETRHILSAGLRHGLKPKVHANELDRSGGVQVAVELAARSADHLECVEQEELDLLAASHTIPVLLPGTAFFLGIHPPPARRMLDNNLPVALSSDYNPGTCPSGNMEFVISLATAMLKMQPAEAIHAATINSAFAMDTEKEAGRLAPGRTANLLITKAISSPGFIPYHFGESSLEKVMIRGQWM
jgi:imidazolonepropionase